MLALMAHKLVPERPGRAEARVRKRRPKSYPEITNLAHHLINKLLKNVFSSVNSVKKFPELSL